MLREDDIVRMVRSDASRSRQDVFEHSSKLVDFFFRKHPSAHHLDLPSTLYSIYFITCFLSPLPQSILIVLHIAKEVPDVRTPPFPPILPFAYQ